MPMGSMAKFFADQGGPGSEHGGKLHWPGTAEGFPFRGDSIPDLRQREFTDIPLALDYKSDLFKLWEPEHKARFDSVMERIVNGWYMQHKRKDIDVPDELMPAVYLEWIQVYGETPNGKHPGLRESNVVSRKPKQPQPSAALRTDVIREAD